MIEISQADRYLLEQVRNGSSEGWNQLIERYQGRLLAFARNKVRRCSDVEDVVQETFVSFLKGLEQFRAEASLETYLFTILRRRIADSYRGKKVTICLLQDVMPGGAGGTNGEPAGDAAQWIAGREPTASWYARRDEQEERFRTSLVAALRKLVGGLKQSLFFRDLKIVEMLFYCQLGNKAVAQAVRLNEKHVALIKHRSLKQIKQCVCGKLGDADAESSGPGRSAGMAALEDGSLLSEVWQQQRLSCPKRSTIGAWLLGTLNEGWQGYVDFHLNKLGCQYCRANLEDIKRQTSDRQGRSVRQRILESTVGFLRKH